MATSPDQEALALVHRGWDHLRRQRPLAAWASWQQALRLRPDQPAALQALELRARADDLPAAARADYRFRNPSGPEARARWDARLQGRDLADPAAAALAFGELADADPTDAAARYNQALCLAWAGANAPAVDALARAVALDAASGAEEVAAAAWTLAEVLRQGAGAEALADDRDHVLTLAWGPDDGEPEVLEPLVPVPIPAGPAPGEGVRAFEWLDRPPPAGADDPELAEIPRVLATLIRLPDALRLSSPNPVGLVEAEGRLLRSGLGPEREVRRDSTPLPLTLLDAAIWTFRLPAGLDADSRRRLSRAAVEAYYEDRWIHVARRGLDGRTPLEASAASAGGDPVARAKLAGVVRLREQLGARTRTADLYGGYPFDRLRRRLGLELVDPGAVDPADLSCMSGPELDRIDPSGLDDAALASTFHSAAGLGDDARTARFAAELAGRLPGEDRPGLARVDPERVVSVLVRDALAREGLDRALGWLDRAVEVGGAGRRETFEIRRAELLARRGSPEEALRVYDPIVGRGRAGVWSALDAAGHLLDRGDPDRARALVARALEVAGDAGDADALAAATALLAEIDRIDP